MKSDDKIRSETLALKQENEDRTAEQITALLILFEDSLRELQVKVQERMYRLNRQNKKITPKVLAQPLDNRDISLYRLDLEGFSSLGATRVNPRLENRLKVANTRPVSEFERMNGYADGVTAKLWNKIDNDSRKFYNDNFSRLYYRDVKMLQDAKGVYEHIEKLDEEFVRQLIDERWASDGRSYFERITNHAKTVTGQIQNEFKKLLQGSQSIDRAFSNIKDTLTVNYNKMAVLIDNESMHHFNQAEIESAKTMGVTHYEYNAVLDLRTTMFCRDRDKMVFRIEEYEPGNTAPPHGANCRSIIILKSPWDKDYPTVRRAIDHNGVERIIDGSIPYWEWHRQYVGDAEAELLGL